VHKCREVWAPKVCVSSVFISSLGRVLAPRILRWQPDFREKKFRPFLFWAILFVLQIAECLDPVTEGHLTQFSPKLSPLQYRSSDQQFCTAETINICSGTFIKHRNLQQLQATFISNARLWLVLSHSYLYVFQGLSEIF